MVHVYTLKYLGFFITVFSNSSAWTDILYQLKLDARQFLLKNADRCLECVLIDKQLDEVIKFLL